VGIHKYGFADKRPGWPHPSLGGEAVATQGGDDLTSIVGAMS